MKRSLDIVVSLVLLVGLAPVLAMVAIAVLSRLGRPVMFVQLRPGRNGVPFRMLKFRTMRDARGPSDELLPDEERTTRLGHFLRTTSLDELPGLWNVLRGEMSLVGPRPLLMDYLPLYTPEQARRHSVRPGITGWAQINGRNALSWEDKLALDLWYVDNQSIGLDLKILALTVSRVLRRSGTSMAAEPALKRASGAPGESAGRP